MIFDQLDFKEEKVMDNEKIEKLQDVYKRQMILL